MNMVINLGDIAATVGSFLVFGLLIFMAIAGFKKNSKQQEGKDTKNCKQ